MTTAKQYDFLNRLTSISSSPSSSGPVSFAYLYNNANQRIQAVLADGSRWIYQYDRLGQVISGKKYWADWTPVAGQQFEYGFDDIGNRTSTKAGGDEAGGSLRPATYSRNLLNQDTSRTVPGYVDIVGIGLATDTISVNSQGPYRKGEYFRKELVVDNTGSSAWTGVSVAASGETTIAGNRFLPKTPEEFSYDADGNLTQDGHWNYAWDGENRLVGLTNRAAAAPAQVARFEYDSKCRRIHKRVWSNSDGSGAPATELKFLYDGWNLVSVLRSDLSVLTSFMWGLDLSGTPQGAGGVGGLLEVVYYGAATTNCFAAFDGNGNVAALVNGGDGTVAAQYEYGPFGEVIRATGPLAKSNPFRFSTKYQDDETDLLYYGYRYYNASAGRWISRDPIGKRGSQNCYAYCANNAQTACDALGMLSFDVKWHLKTKANDPIWGDDPGGLFQGETFQSGVDYTKASHLDKQGCLTYDVEAKVHYDIYILDGVDPEQDKTSSGRTLGAHEMGHVSYYNTALIGFEEAFNHFTIPCRATRCKSKFEKWMQAAFEQAKVQSKHDGHEWDIESDDYPAGGVYLAFVQKYLDELNTKLGDLKRSTSDTKAAYDKCVADALSR
jgi:RHS repeat-associated protein